MATQPSYSPGPAPVTTADELAVIVQRARTFTNASGAATAIRQPNTNEIICRARSGAGAPDVGTVLRIEGTFTGMCISSGKELLCDDAHTDGRVDTSAIRALGVRSIVVVPIKEDARVLGVLAVFSPAACAFSSLHVATLNALADQISMLLRKERRSKTARPREPQVSRPDFSAHANASSQILSKGPVASVATGAEASRSTPVFERDAPEAETNQAAREEIVPPIIVPEQIENHKEKRPESTGFDSDSRIRELQLAVASRLGVDQIGGISEKRTNPVPKKFIVTTAIAAVLVAAFVTIGLLKNSRPETPRVSGENSSIVPTAPNQNASSPGSNAKPNKLQTGSQSQSKRNQRPQKNEQPGKRVPAPVATVTLPNSKIAINSGLSASQSQDVAPGPSLSVASTSDLSLLTRPVSTVAPGTGFHPDLVSAKAIRTVRPIYPELARKGHIGGSVVLLVNVGKDGKVTNPQYISGPAILRNAAVDAVKQWLFKPAMLNGAPTEQETRITVNFKP